MTDELMDDAGRLEALASLVRMRGSVVIHLSGPKGMAIDYGAFGFSASGDLREICDGLAGLQPRSPSTETPDND